MHKSAVILERVGAVSLTLIFCLLSTGFLFAQKPIPELWGQRVHDEAKVLSQATLDQLELDLKKYEDSTTNQIAILIVQSLDGVPAEEYSISVAEKWKLGTAKKDNGVLLFISVDDRKIRIEVGQGLEGVLTDAQTNRIIRNEMAPNFRRGDYNAGVVAGISGITRSIGGEYTALDSESTSKGDTLGEKIIMGIFIFGILGVFTMITLFSRGCAGWGLYAFLIPFYAVFPWVVIGMNASMVLLIIYIIGMPIAKAMMGRTAWGKDQLKKWQTSSGSSSGSGSGWSMGSGWGSSGGGGGGFSGGGGSFGGGGSSGSW